MYTARHSQTLDSQLQAEQDTLVQRAMCHMLHSTLLWTFMAFSFSGRDGSHMAGIWWTKPCTQAHGASHGPEGEGALGKSNKLWLQFGLSLGPKLTNSYNILFTTSERISFVSDHSHRIQCGTESDSSPDSQVQADGGRSLPGLFLWNKSVCILSFLVQATSEWRDEFPH
jgi:hypothetical protein